VSLQVEQINRHAHLLHRQCLLHDHVPAAADLGDGQQDRQAPAFPSFLALGYQLAAQVHHLAARPHTLHGMIISCVLDALADYLVTVLIAKDLIRAGNQQLTPLN
jgi:hypothetical protein